MENSNQDGIISPDVVLTRKTGLATILVAIARKGEQLNELYLKYIPIKGSIKEGEHNPEETCNMVLRLLSNSFGWFEIEHERKIIVQEFESVDQLGQKQKYKAHVWIIPIRKHGALIRK